MRYRYAARMAEELDSIRERAALMHEALTDLRAEQIDSRSLLISIVALVFLPVTFITGLYGLNVENLPYAKEPWARSEERRVGKECVRTGRSWGVAYK